MKKLLVICGATATGKTSLALHLAKIFNGELISADSRQVYRGLDIGTGKDLPADSRFQISTSKLKIGYYLIEGIKLWGYDLVSPNEEFSVSHYIKFATNKVNEISVKGKLPILVGGTGLYIKGVIDGIGTSDIPKNEKLRFELETKNSEELFGILKNLNNKKALSMNDSDRKNPRRLVRAIEIAMETPSSKFQIANRIKYDTLFIGLTAAKELIAKKIEERVLERLNAGVENEIKNMLGSGVDWDMQSMNTLGYKEWKEYFAGRISKAEAITKWISDENKYAKRQLTWFKKDRRINWFDITEDGWKEEVAKTIEKWENK